MIKKFLNYIVKNNLPKPDDNYNILLAVSGGIDSVVLCDLFHKVGYKFSIAHANFKLRGNDSELDQKFVENIAIKYRVQLFTEKFETQAFAENNKVSIQMAARELRFKWFFEICEKYSFHFVATAHHLDDQAETFFINLFRGASLKAIAGLKPLSDKIFHPLLFASRADIVNYAKDNKIKYRDDMSNDSDKYIRNNIRHNFLPLIDDVYKGATKSVISTCQKLQDVNEFIDNIIDQINPEIIIKHHNFVEINTNLLFKYKPIRLYLFEIIKSYGFKYNTIDDIIAASLKKLSGKIFYSDKYKLLIDRNKILITDILTDENYNSFINETDNECITPVKLKIKYVKKNNDFVIPADANIACLDYSKLTFPLNVRTWQKGDKFYPLGMKTSKKISDFLIDNKVPLIFKEKVFLLCSNDKIVWVIGMRIDNRFKTTSKTKNLCIISKI